MQKIALPPIRNHSAPDGFRVVGSNGGPSQPVQKADTGEVQFASKNLDQTSPVTPSAIDASPQTNRVRSRS